RSCTCSACPTGATAWRASARARARSAPASTRRTSTTPVSRGHRAGGPRARSPIRRISGRRSRKPSRWSRRASRRSSTPLPSRVEVKHMRLVRSNLRHTLVCSLGLAALAAGLALGSSAALAAGDAAKGKQNFMKYGCWQCHGTVGQGGAGPKLAPEPLPFEALSSFVRNTNRAMPPYREAVLPNSDLEDIYAYLSSIPKPADYKTIPLLSE